MHKQSDNKEGIHDNAVSFKRFYSLQERCGQILRTFITINKVDELDLPQHLKEELKNSIRTSLKYKCKQLKVLIDTS
ncbi:hypothetical protein KUTeg_022557 [Tegillarca granosa]|uniref:Uncharacterized protein n=1 Tax=Tegillarca granosa TaxID=220873 RepID=A0ABQ9E6K9_TEGGR|nr:hypothetical protein KUTeg_022557 [Tegillarca granosa]